MKNKIMSYKLVLNENESTFLNIIRVISCEVVLFGHILTYFKSYPLEGKIPYIQSLAVSLFFILSGFLAMYSWHKKKLNVNQEYGMTDYFINRVSRIYPAYIFSLIFILFMDGLNIHYSPEKYSYYGSYNKTGFFVSFFMLNNASLNTIFSQFTFSSFGSAVQLWTLAIEWWCYMIFGLIAFGFSKYKNRILYWVVTTIVAFIPIYNFIFGSVTSPSSISYDAMTFTWFMGVISFLLYYLILKTEININLNKKNSVITLSIILVLALARILFVNSKFNINYDVLFSILMSAFIVFGLYMGRKNVFDLKPIKNISKIFASFSFTLYLTHYSILDFAVNNFSERVRNDLLMILLFFICNIFAYIVAIFFEKYIPSFMEKFLKNKYNNFKFKGKG